jgi:hypothetical protein
LILQRRYMALFTMLSRQKINTFLLFMDLIGL